MKKKLRTFLLGALLLAFTAAAIQYVPTVVSVSNSAGGRDLPIYCVDTPKPQISLTFDAAWGNEDTQKILNILKNHNIKATFFMTGGWVEKYPDDVLLIQAAGHDLGNHSETHKHMNKLSNEEKQEEIMMVHEKVKKLTGKDMTLFRAPYGEYDNDVIRTVVSCGYYPIQWSVDSLDWKDYGADSIVETVVNSKSLENGAIILCHNGAKYTAQALDELITSLEGKGFEFVPVSQLIYKDKYHMDVTGKQISDK
ncbi:MAG: polysaccharide deacetylase family protein [Eubacteriales bacterium]|nr:polysaccharide deacetylase family protein [Eubacteriales bacterium]